MAPLHCHCSGAAEPINSITSMKRFLSPLLLAVVAAGAIAATTNFPGTRSVSGSSSGNTNSPGTTPIPNPAQLATYPVATTNQGADGQIVVKTGSRAKWTANTGSGVSVAAGTNVTAETNGSTVTIHGKPGTVTSVSSAEFMTGLYQVTVSNPTTTPTISYTKELAQQNHFLAGPYNSNGQWSFRPITYFDIPVLTWDHVPFTFAGVTNTGSGISLIVSSNPPVAKLKKLIQGSNITLTDGEEGVTIASTAAGTGTLTGITNTSTTAGAVSIIQSSNSPVPILKKLVAGSNVTLTDQGSNVVVNATGDGVGISASDATNAATAVFNQLSTPLTNVLRFGTTLAASSQDTNYIVPCLTNGVRYELVVTSTNFNFVDVTNYPGSGTVLIRPTGNNVLITWPTNVGYDPTATISGASYTKTLTNGAGRFAVLSWIKIGGHNPTNNAVSVTTY